MATQRLKEGQTFPANRGSDPRIGLAPAQKGSGFPGTKTNGKVFANMSPGEVSGAGQSNTAYTSQGGPSLKGAPKKTPSEDKSSRGET